LKEEHLALFIRCDGVVAATVDVNARCLADIVDVVARNLAGVVDEDDNVEVIAQQKGETHDGERDRYSKVVEAYSRSAVILRRKKLTRK
jgi:hypothetical protein